MEFDRPFRASVFLLVQAGAVTLSAAEIKLERGSALYLVVSVLAVILAWWLVETPLGRAGNRGLPRWFANTLAFAACGFAYIDANAISQDGLLVLAHLLLWIQLIKLFQRKLDRDWIQLVLLSLMHLGAAAALTIQATFAVSLLVYLVVGAFAMLFYTLRKESAETTAAGGRVVMVGARERWSMALLVFGMILFVLVATAVFFLVFPRTGQEFIRLDFASRTTRSGFADGGMRLGSINRLLDNPALAMTVKVEGGVVPVGELRMRGTVYDRYKDGNWDNDFSNLKWEHRRIKLEPGGAQGGGDWSRRNKDIHLHVQPLLTGSLRSGDVTAVATAKVVEFDVTLEPSDSRVLFTHNTTVTLLGGDGTFDQHPLWEERATGVVRQHKHSAGKFHYRMVCHIGSGNLELYEPHEGARAELVGRDNYLALPPELESSGRIRELALSIVNPEAPPQAQAQALMRWLRDTCRYSTEDLSTPARHDPTEYFLFERRVGHCEFFASALALMLRAIGIPSRIVGGFVGGEYNDIAEVYSVRQSRAHAWVEAHFDGVSQVVQGTGSDVYSTGWLTLDPTPARAVDATSGFMGWLQKLLGLAKVKWDSHVLGFEQRHQETMFKEVSVQGDAMVRTLRSVWRSLTGVGGGRSATGVLMACLCLIAAWLVFHPGSFRRNRPGRGGETFTSPVEFYAAVIELLAHHGHERPPGETPAEFARRLRSRDLELPTLLTERYNAVRYGGSELSADEAAEVQQWLDELAAELELQATTDSSLN